MTLQLEVGKTYVTNDGRTVKIVNLNPGCTPQDKYAFQGEWGDDYFKNNWDHDGCFSGGDHSYSKSIKCEHKESTLQVGVKYKTVSGSFVTFKRLGPAKGTLGVENAIWGYLNDDETNQVENWWALDGTYGWGKSNEGSSINLAHQIATPPPKQIGLPLHPIFKKKNKSYPWGGWSEDRAS